MARVQITKCEAEVMEVVWDKGRVTIAEVVEAINRKLAYTTVLTTMRILESKKIVCCGEKRGRAHTYLPVVSREEVRHGMVYELTQQLFGGSVRSLVLSLLDSDTVSPEDIAVVKEAAAKAERRQ